MVLVKSHKDMFRINITDFNDLFRDIPEAIPSQ